MHVNIKDYYNKDLRAKIGKAGLIPENPSFSSDWANPNLQVFLKELSVIFEKEHFELHFANSDHLVHQISIWKLGDAYSKKGL